MNGLNIDTEQRQSVAVICKMSHGAIRRKLISLSLLKKGMEDNINKQTLIQSDLDRR